MSGKYKLLCVILACVFVILTLTSCVGIGDGAMFDNITTDEEQLKDITLAELTLPLPATDDSCVINMYNSEGHSSSRTRLNAELKNELRELLEADDYTQGYNASETNSYIHVLFKDDNGKKDGYVIFRNDSVGYFFDGADKTVAKGKKDGAYNAVLTLITRANARRSSEEKAAGYSFTSLLVCAEQSKSFPISDFSTLDCIGIFHLSDDNTAGRVYYTFYFDCDTRERIDEIAQQLAAREDIISVSYNYIVLPAA